MCGFWMLIFFLAVLQIPVHVIECLQRLRHIRRLEQIPSKPSSAMDKIYTLSKIICRNPVNAKYRFTVL